jgi:hypothetical protein
MHTYLQISYRLLFSLVLPFDQISVGTILLKNGVRMLESKVYKYVNRGPNLLEYSNSINQNLLYTYNVLPPLF